MIATKIRTRPLRAVTFICPHCGVDRNGSVVDRRRWLVLGWVPVVPVGKLGPMVECDVCRQSCGVGVLNVPTSAALETLLHTALRHAIVTVVRAGRRADETNDEVERFAVSIMRNAGYLYDRFDLDDDLRNLSDHGTAPNLHPIADELTMHGKQSMLHRLHGLATVDGPMRPAQRDAVVRIGVALGLGAPHINGIIAVAEAEHSER